MNNACRQSGGHTSQAPQQRSASLRSSPGTCQPGFSGGNAGCTCGTIFHIEAHSARDISTFSQFPHEKEAILLPDFIAVVKGPVTVDKLGFQHITLQEWVPHPPGPVVDQYAAAKCMETLQSIVKENQDKERTIARKERKEQQLIKEYTHLIEDITRARNNHQKKIQKLTAYKETLQHRTPHGRLLQR